MKKTLLGTVLILGMFLVGSLSANAADLSGFTGWTTASVDYVGPNALYTPKIVLTLTHADTAHVDYPVFEEQYFKLYKEHEKEVLAVVLTAMSLDRDIAIHIMSDQLTIDAVYLAR